MAEHSPGRRTRARLTVKAVQAAGPGMHSDGDGLYLNVMPSGTRAWIYRYQLDGKRREIGLGGFPLVSLADARSRALTIRAGIKSGGADPLAARREAVAEKARVASEAKAAAPRSQPLATLLATTSVLTAPPGATPSTPRSGTAPYAPTPSRCLGRRLSTPSTASWSLRC